MLGAAGAERMPDPQPTAVEFVDTEWGLVEVFPPPPGQGKPDCRVTAYAPDADGYPTTRRGGKHVKVHRAACEWAHGPPPQPGCVVLHACDHPACVNPAHLSWGTQLDNIKDMVAKGRQRGGRRPKPL